MSMAQSQWRGALMDFARMFPPTRNSPALAQEPAVNDLFFGYLLRKEVLQSRLYETFHKNPFAWVFDNTKVKFLQEQRDNDASRTTHAFTLSYVLTQYQMPNESTPNVNKLALKMLVSCQPLMVCFEKIIPPRCSDWLHMWSPPVKTYKGPKAQQAHEHRFPLMSLQARVAGKMLSFLDVLRRYGTPVSVSALVATCKYFSMEGNEKTGVQTGVRFLYKDQMVSALKKSTHTSEYHPICYETGDVKYALLCQMHEVVARLDGQISEQMLFELCLMCQTIYFHVLVGNLSECDNITNAKDISIMYWEIMKDTEYKLTVKRTELSEDDLATLLEMGCILAMRFHGCVDNLAAIMR